MQSQCSWGAEQFPQFSGQSDTAERTAESGGGGGEPDFISRRRPRSSNSACPAVRQVRFLPVQVNYADGAAIVAEKVVVNKRDPITLRREAKIANPPGSLIQNFANGILNTALAVRDVDHRQ